MLGGHARVHGHFGGGLVEGGLVGQGVELVAGQGLAALGDDAQIGGDAGCGQRVVAGDHHRADAGAVRLGDGVAHLGARRVDDADHAVPDQVAFDDVALLGDIGHLAGGVGLDAGDVGERRGAERTIRLAKRTVRLAGQLLDGGEDRLTVAFGERADRTADRDARAVAEQHVGGALREHGQVAVVAAVLADDRHALALGSEGDLGHAGELAERTLRLDLARGDDQRDLGRIADDLPLPVRSLTQIAVVRERADRDGMGRFERDRGPVGDSGAVEAQHLALRGVAGAGELHFTARGDDALDAQLLDDGVVLGHALHAERKHDGQDRRQAFRHGGDGQRHGQQQGIDDVVDGLEALREEQRDQHERRDDAHGDAEDLGDMGHLLLQRRILVVGLGQHVGDLADLRVHAGAGDDRTAGALSDGRAVEDHVGTIAERLGAFQRIGLLADRYGFAGQARLGDAQRRGGEQSSIGGDGVALAEHDDVAGHDIGRIDVNELAVAQHRSLRRGHLGERLDRLLGAGFLNVPQYRVDDQDQDDDNRIERQHFAAFRAGRGVGLFNEPRDQRDDGGRQQQVYQRILELGQELLPLGHRRRAGQLVRTEFLKSPLGLGFAQADGRIDIKRCGDVVRIGQAGIHIVQQRHLSACFFGLRVRCSGLICNTINHVALLDIAAELSALATAGPSGAPGATVRLRGYGHRRICCRCIPCHYSITLFRRVRTA